MSDYKNEVPVEIALGQWQLSYEVKDTRGTVVSRTMLTGKSSQECYSKLVHAHKEASAAVERLRRHNVQKAIPVQIGSADEETLKLQTARASAEGSRAGYEFMKAHLRDYFPCQANAQILGATLEAEGLPWTTENLEIAFELSKHRLTSGSAPPAAEEPIAVVEMPVVPEAAPSAAAGKPWEAIRTKQDIAHIGRDQYKSWMLSPAFKQHVNAILAGGGQ